MWHLVDTNITEDFFFIWNVFKPFTIVLTESPMSCNKVAIDFLWSAYTDSQRKSTFVVGQFHWLSTVGLVIQIQISGLKPLAPPVNLCFAQTLVPVNTRMNHLFLEFSMLSETIMMKPFDTIFNVLTRRNSILLQLGVSRHCSL